MWATPAGDGKGDVPSALGPTDLYDRVAHNLFSINMVWTLIAGFLAVDFFFFHDIFKTGEVTSLPQYMTGILSLAVFAICGQSLLKSDRLAI